MKTVLTYGTFDLLYIRHPQPLRWLRVLGDRLIVGVSTHEFNAEKGKHAVVPFADRIEIVRALRCMDHAFPEVAARQRTHEEIEGE